jgi:ParB-like chromosome segregation protein Spo0J
VGTLTAISRAPVTLVPIADITIGVRRRKRIKALSGLAESVKARGLLHPILLRNGNELVAGHRRLEACRALGWKEIPARHVDTLSDEDFRLIELEENTERLDLDSFEQSRQRLAEIRQAEAKAKDEALVSGPSGARKSTTGGRPKGCTPGSGRDVAERTGISRGERHRVEQHVVLAEKFPVFQRPEWRKHQVLRAGEALANVPVKEQSRVAHLIDQDALPPADAIAIIENVGTMPVEERQRVLKAAASDDQHERERALVYAAKTPPQPDPRLAMLDHAHDSLKRAAAFKRDDWQPTMRTLAETVAAAIRAMEQDYRKAREAAWQ